VHESNTFAPIYVHLPDSRNYPPPKKTIIAGYPLSTNIGRLVQHFQNLVRRQAHSCRLADVLTIVTPTVPAKVPMPRRHF